MFALVDANAFYCSAEQVFNPQWRNKPIVVLSNNDGCIVAANRLALAAGVKKFTPYFEAKALCERKGIIALSSNYELYGSLSSALMEVIGRFAPEQHIYSIDESFLSFKQCQFAIPCLTQHAQLIRRTVWKETRLPVCVGIGQTLTLAKVANHAAKKIQGYNGVCCIDSVTKRREILACIKPSDVWGIGRKLAQRLEKIGIVDALQLANMPARLAKKQFSVEVERIVRELNGEVCKVWDEVRADKKQIFSTRSVGTRITDKASLSQALSRHACIAAEKARQQGSMTSTMLIFASNSPFDDTQAGFKYHYHFSQPTNDSCQLIKAATTICAQLFRGGVRYYKVGVGLIDLSPEAHYQYDLFAKRNKPAMMQVMDKLNYRFGSESVFIAANGIAPKWHMRRDMLTPQYTTNWHDIPKIHCV
ncbi:Y-family DNA polymerase [Shewanella intestini]|uniref:Y-family DNA polymerase n=1 Tax=Shewanella intestini TaxID=2017544 RepID=A0ABS5HZQ6_9GAMM|nr:MULTISPECIES: Y-family DNA polymerase [Shewanella]MBR9727269.1 Y-family DNA polymerase [Shewanella intestini]MRG36071.1 DUF4113 domain-containing protein [Shewanella sp. XMDDZSB0408]